MTLVFAPGGDQAQCLVHETATDQPVPMTDVQYNGINGFTINGNQPDGLAPNIINGENVQLEIDGGVAGGDTWTILRPDFLTINGRPTIFDAPLTGTVTA